MSSLWQPPSLAGHTNRAQVMLVMHTACTMGPWHLTRLALAFDDSATRARARDEALSPDTFAAADALETYSALAQVVQVGQEVTLNRLVVTGLLPHDHALRAGRALLDALAGAWARDTLHPAHYWALVDPWASVSLDPGPEDGTTRTW